MIAVRVALAALALTPAVLPAQSAEVVIDGRMHHLRSGQVREWASFPVTAEGPALVVAFAARTTPAGERTLRLRHRDLKQAWRVLMNGTEIARLPPARTST